MGLISPRPMHPGAQRWNEERQRSLGEITRAAEQDRAFGNVGRVHRAVAEHIHNVEAKAAIIERLQRTKPWVELGDPFRVAASLNLQSLPRSMRTGRWCVSSRPNSRPRLTASLSWPLRVSQLVVKDVLCAAHEPADHVGDWPGRGVSYHLGRVCADLRHGSHILLADVQNCFPSVQPEGVYRIGPLPPDLVHSCCDSRRIRLRAPHRRRLSSMGFTFDGTDRHGLLSGGAASPSMWAVLIDDVTGVLPSGVRAHTYVDNIIIVCTSAHECEEAESALIRYFAEHRAGPFVLRASKADAELGFDHLGYQIGIRDGEVMVAIKDARLAALEQRTKEHVAAIVGTITEIEFQQIADQLLSPWPMLSACSRKAVEEEVRLECALHNTNLGARQLD